MFLALMVGTPGSSSPPHRGPVVDVSSVNGGCSRIFGTASQGGTIDDFCVDGGLSRISDTASHGARHQRFLH
jgi:hypothetical protein